MAESWPDQIRSRAFQPIDAASIQVFRIAFGMALVVEVGRYFANGWITSAYMAPPFHFTYPGLSWVRPWPDIGMYLHFLVLGIAAASFAAGWFPRLSAFVSAVGWTYVLLLEKSAYLNHLYLVCLLFLLMAFVPGTAWARKSNEQSPPGNAVGPVKQPTLPAIALWVLRGQIAIPYVYGALAKLNGDWLQGQPMQMWMSRMTHVRQFVPAFGDMGLALVFSWGGFLLDLLVVPLLLWRRTRPWAFSVAVAFHLTNAVLFQIGIFPWLMIAATSLFFEPAWPREWWSWLQQHVPAFRRNLALPSSSISRTSSTALNAATSSNRNADGTTLRQRGCLVAVGVWFTIQLLVPFRHLLIPGNVDWTEEGQHFSWRMMLCEKAAAMNLLIVDAESKRVLGPLDPRRYLTPTQLNKMSYDPDMLIEFSRYAAEQIRIHDHRSVEIHAQVMCSLNGRRPQPLVDPALDLASQPRPTWSHRAIRPLTEPFASTPWSDSPETWFQTDQRK